MKLMVITNEQGHVVATARMSVHQGSEYPGGGRPVPGPGQRLHEVELPPDFHELKSVAELHEAVTKLLPSAGR